MSEGIAMLCEGWALEGGVCVRPRIAGVRVYFGLVRGIRGC